MQYVFGYTITNDLSERKYNSELAGREKREFDVYFDWLMGKWFDGSAPLGPELVTKDEIPDPQQSSHPIGPERRGRCRTRTPAT